MEEYQNQSLEKAISYCIENFSTKEATKRIIDYIKSDRELTEQLRQYNVVRQSEQLVYSCCEACGCEKELKICEDCYMKNIH